MPVTLIERAKFARSLNCFKCQQPFSSTANEPRTPRLLKKCSIIIYQECFGDEKGKRIENRWHQCKDGDQCFINPNPIYYLMELISLGSLALNSSKSGYILVKDFLAPECPVCHENYDIRDRKKTSFSLYCGHAICLESYQKMREEGDDRKDNLKYSIKCPICLTITMTTRESVDRNRLNDSTIVLTIAALFHMDYMFFCDDCDVEICGACSLRKHRTHKTVDLTKAKGKLLSELVEKIAKNRIETYEKVLPELHTDLATKVEDFKQKLEESIQSLVNIEKYDELNKKQTEYRKLGEEFETISEEYLPSLRGYDTKLQGLLRKLSPLPTPKKKVEKGED